MKSSILIVTADIKNDFFVGSLLSQLEPVTVDSLDAAIKTLKKRRFDICLISFGLTRKSDFQLLKQIQKGDGASDLLIGLEKYQVPAAMETLGGHWDYLISPFSSRELSLKLEKILSKRNLERENRFWRVELSALLADRGTLTLEDIPAEIWEKAGETRGREEGQSFKKSRDEFERECLRRALERAHGSQTKASKALGIHRNTLIWKMKKLNLENEYLKLVRKCRGRKL